MYDLRVKFAYSRFGSLVWDSISGSGTASGTPKPQVWSQARSSSKRLYLSPLLSRLLLPGLAVELTPIINLSPRLISHEKSS
ncbi:hypothetical protein SAY86_007445 [Trapa natans]|uniref:Uncharacterized protein n=1 Tax=Trapa natans TaxID=22666 RepID=A0AAN7LBQ1_TRANT|nr:hypothetical protein SAY86_007445 [Trapa natans]